MTTDDWKTRAESAEKQLAKMMLERFESTIRELVSDRSIPMRNKGAKLLRLFAELLESELPWDKVMPIVDRFGPTMQEVAKHATQEASTP